MSYTKKVKYYAWDEAKNEKLKTDRKISFEDVLKALDQGKELGRIAHPNQDRYPNQTLLIIDINDYAYMVPYIEDEEKVFFKTIIPSRKATKIYLRKEVKK